MSQIPGTPWHRTSWERLLSDLLPALIESRLPGAHLTSEQARPDACTITVTLQPAAASFTLPVPDADGVFHTAARRTLVVPRADNDDLDKATIRCAGELFHGILAEQIAAVEPGWRWDDASLREWLALDTRCQTFLQDCGQPVDDTNWLSAHTQLRRIQLPDRRRMFTRAHLGRVCLVETPEGENIGRVLTVARGAEIRDGRLVILDRRASAGLGLTASMIPFLENSDACRVLMAANMMRQWITPPDPEPALVQTGNEPDETSFWCGRNLLTAYVDRGIDTFEDAILISETCARRLGYPEPIEPGDKLSNRSGNKGVVSRILPDDQMPHLQNGRAVDLAYTPMGLISRLTYGQLREAILSWDAARTNQPAIVPPFEGPHSAGLRSHDSAAGMNQDGMMPLLDRKDGKLLPMPATVGYVYWGRLVHRAQPNLFASVQPTDRCQKIGEPEMHALRLAGAHQTVRELFHTLSCNNAGAASLANRLALGPVTPSEGPAPTFASLQRKLGAAGIRAETGPKGVAYGFSAPSGETLRLAEPMPHPWHPESTVSEVGIIERTSGLPNLIRANDQLSELVGHPFPASLVVKARSELARWLAHYLDHLVSPAILRARSRVMFTGRAVVTPSIDIRHDQVGLPEEMAWTLFAPALARQLGNPVAIENRSPVACETLDNLMARTWVLVHRMPTLDPANFLAFHPVRTEGTVIRLHPMANVSLNADYDGDRLEVFLPVTEEAQREAGEKLTFAAHVRHNRRADRCSRPLFDGMYGPVTRRLYPRQGARFGLAWLALSPEGRAQIERTAGVPIPLEDGVLTTGSLNAAVERMLETGTVEDMLDALDRLWKLGFEVSAETGVSLSAFPSSPIEAPAPPLDNDVDAWASYHEEYLGRVVAWLNDPESGPDPARIIIRSGARAIPRQWLSAIGLKGVAIDCDGIPVPVKHSQAIGLSPEEATVCYVGMREGLARAVKAAFDPMHEMCEADLAPAFGVLARARRARRPGVVFARAAAAGEVDPLADPVSRLLVGLV